MYEYTGPKHMPEKQELKYGIFNENNITKMQEDIAELKQGGGGGGSAEQVQSDWNETDATAKAFINNKPFDVETIGFIIDGTEPTEEFGYADYSGVGGFNKIYYSEFNPAYEKAAPKYGDVITINYNGKTLSGVFSKKSIPMPEAEGASYLCDVASNTEDLILTGGGIALPGNIDNAFAFTRRLYISEEETYETFVIAINDSEFDTSSTEPIIITMTGPIVSKLSGDKIKIDNATIKLNTNNALTAPEDAFVVTNETLSADLLDAWDSGKICVYKTEYNTYYGFYKYSDYIYFNSFQSDTYTTSNPKIRTFGKKISVSSTVVSVSNVYDDYLITNSCKATNANIGLVRPDNSTITVNPFGEIKTAIPAPPTSVGEYALYRYSNGSYRWELAESAWIAAEDSGTAGHASSATALQYTADATKLLIGVKYKGLYTSAILPLTYDGDTVNSIMLGSNDSTLDGVKIAARVTLASNHEVYVKAFSAAGSGWSTAQPQDAELILMYQED